MVALRSARCHLHPPHNLQASARDIINLFQKNYEGHLPEVVIGHSMGGKVRGAARVLHLHLLRLLGSRRPCRCLPILSAINIVKASWPAVPWKAGYETSANTLLLVCRLPLN